MLKKKLSLLIFLFFSQGSFAFKFNQNSSIKSSIKHQMRKIFIYDVNGNLNHMNIILGLESEEVEIRDAVKMMEKVRQLDSFSSSFGILNSVLMLL